MFRTGPLIAFLLSVINCFFLCKEDRATEEWPTHSGLMIDASGWKDQISLPVGRWEGSVKHIREGEKKCRFNTNLIWSFMTFLGNRELIAKVPSTMFPCNLLKESRRCGWVLPVYTKYESLHGDENNTPGFTNSALTGRNKPRTCGFPLKERRQAPPSPAFFSSPSIPSCLALCLTHYELHLPRALGIITGSLFSPSFIPLFFKKKK